MGGTVKGTKFSEEHKNKIRQSMFGKHVGELSGNWNGGCWPYWRLEALKRDDYTCQICGHREKEIMEVDHIKPQSKFPELKLIIENLVTLCPNCHARKTNRERKDLHHGNKYFTTKKLTQDP